MFVVIVYSEKTQTFHLQNSQISYVIGIKEGRYLTHHYWGKRLETIHSKPDYQQASPSFYANPYEQASTPFSLGTLLQEFPGTDTGDHREAAYTYTDQDGYRANQLIYKRVLFIDRFTS